MHVGDGLGFEPPDHVGGPTVGFTRRPRCARSSTRAVATPGDRDAHARRRRLARHADVGSRRCSNARARATRRCPPRFAQRKTRLDVRAVRRPPARRSRRCSPPTARWSRCAARSRSRPRASARSTRRSCASSSAASARRRSCSARSTWPALARGLVPPDQRAESPAAAGRRPAAAASRLGARGEARRTPASVSRKRCAAFRVARAFVRRCDDRARSSLSAQVFQHRRRAMPPRPAGATEDRASIHFCVIPSPPVARVRALARAAAARGCGAAPPHADDRSPRRAARAFRSGSTSVCRS